MPEPAAVLRTTAELRQRLHTLKLPAMARLFPDLALRAATANLTHEAFLDELVAAECAQRDERRLARLLRASGLPLEKTFRTLQLDRFPAIIRQQLERLRRGDFVEEAINVVAVGRPFGRLRARRQEPPAGGARPRADPAGAGGVLDLDGQPGAAAAGGQAGPPPAPGAGAAGPLRLPDPR